MLQSHMVDLDNARSKNLNSRCGSPLGRHDLNPGFGIARFRFPADVCQELAISFGMPGGQLQGGYTGDQQA